MNIQKVFDSSKAVEVETIMTDSRLKCEKGIFFCMEGFSFDGHDFADNAIENGAVVIVHQKELANYNPAVTYVKVDSVVKALNDFCAAFYDNVTEKMKVYGVTGTNGKTTIAFNLNSMLSKFEKSGYIGTIGVIYDDFAEEGNNTTPGINDLHKTIRNMYDCGCSAVAMEVSSQGLDMHRTDSVKYDVAIYTNLSHEHLDYHGNMENYFLAKQRFFTEVISDSTVAIINIDDPYSERLLETSKGIKRTYSISKPADYQAVDIKLYADHSTFTLICKGNRYFVDADVLAYHNVSNIVSCIAALVETGYDIDKVIESVKQLPQVPGRAQIVKDGQPFNVIIDYGNTPEGCEKIYQFARMITGDDHRIITVFGAAGDRDPKKRPLMGAASDRYCDVIIISSDDCHTEPFQQIADMIAEGVKEHSYVIIEDRYEAIRQAVSLANPGDTITLLAKGDEAFFKNGPGTTKVYYMGDINAAHEAIRELY